MIPKIIHQTWKTKDVPKRWQKYTEKVKKLNPDWSYRLWTDEDNDKFVREEFPDFYPVFAGFSKNILRADIIRYLILYKMGGVYLDLDYEVLKPFAFGDKQIILPLEESIEDGFPGDMLGNCFLASVPGHKFWYDAIKDLQNNPPDIKNYPETLNASGPGFLTRIYNSGIYTDIDIPKRIVYHPYSWDRTKADVKKVRNNGVTLGIHHFWGSWQEKWTFTYIIGRIKDEIMMMRRGLGKMFGK